MTHAFIALAHGRILDAIHCNLMSPLVFAAVLLAFAVSLYDLLAGTTCLRRLWAKGERFVVPLTLVLALMAWSWNIYKAS